MNKTLPDKYIRKSLYELLDGIIVDDETIRVYDVRVTGIDPPDHYVLMTTQTNTVDKANKCEYFWDSSILLDVVTSFQRQGNPGSRLLVDNILDAIRDEIDTNGIVLDGGLEVINITMQFPNDITTVTDTEVIHRKFIRLELLIK